VRYLEGYSLRRWTWEHFENQLEIKQSCHQWELERVYNQQLELMSLERRKMVSGQDPKERKWLETIVWLKRSDSIFFSIKAM
jgi:hypothetical protein